MKKLIFKSVVLLLFPIVFHSCVSSTDDDLKEGDIRSEYVGAWDWNDSSSKKDFLSVSISIDKGSDDMIVIDNFHGIGPVYAKVYGDGLRTIIIEPSLLEGLPIKGDGGSNYGYSEITIEYEFDGSSFSAELTK